MATAEKAAAIADLTDKFSNSDAAVFTEYRGLSVSQITQLRNDIREHATYAVVKNTLTKRAAAEAGVTGFDEYLQGPTAIAFVTGDPVEAAKGLRDFAKANPALVIKAGLLDGNTLSPEDITKLADLESRDTLLAKLAGAMNASLSNAASLFQAPLAQTARLAEALRAKVEEEGPAEAPAAEATEAAPEQDTPSDDADVDASEGTEADTAEATEAAAESKSEDTADVAEGGDDN